MTSPARGTSRWSPSLALVLAALGRAALAAGGVSAPYVDRHLGPFVHAQVLRAAERLAQEPCALVLTDFSDQETGRPLAEKFHSSWKGVPGYVSTLVYRPGAEDGPCRDSSVAAYTSPGSAVVYVCRRFLRWQASREMNLPTTILIHEALHTLGLGENPPTTEEITARIEARCRR
jgi:hypothetical protein